MLPKRIIITGGGTGGHIFPAVAIGHALQALRPGTELLFVGANGKMEMEKVPQEGFPIVGLDIAGMNRSNMLKNLLLPFKLFKSLQAAKGILHSFRPDAVVGVGGYASFPVLKAAQGKGIPTIIQEQNSFAGKSNQWLGKKADAICVAYSGMETFFPADKIQLTGNPVRKIITEATISKEEAARHFGLDPSRKTLLIIGGSLGAHSINKVIQEALPDLLAKGLQLLWQTGKPFYEEAQQAAAGYSEQVVVKDFIREMDAAYAAADLIVSRAGALAIAEICLVGKPVIFVPYPFAAEDHQTSNAQALVKVGAAQMVADDKVAAELPAMITALAASPEIQMQMQKALQTLAIRDADVRIAEKIFELTDKSNAR